VVVHTVVSASQGASPARLRRLIAAIAYTLSGLAAVLHIGRAVTVGAAPSQAALWLLTIGFAVLLAALLIVTRHDSAGRRALWVAALAVFAVSALHLSQHRGNDDWWIEMMGHHASLPLALAILHQDYRFALADIFLKRALLLLFLVGTSAMIYTAVAVPALRWLAVPTALTPGSLTVLMGVSIAIALLAPLLQRASARLIDRFVLRRSNYEEVVAEAARQLALRDTVKAVLEEVSRSLAHALNAAEVGWTERAAEDPDAGRPPAIVTTHARQTAARVSIPTAEAPYFTLSIGALEQGRRLLSGDTRMLESVAVIAARRIDALRVAQERYERAVREQEISRLASEAELRAIRAQLNPHFLFNALTTIGYLVQTAPDKALETLLRLSALLRGVLRPSNDEFTTLGDELDLVLAYLEIERARFEERLELVVDVPSSLRAARIPWLVLQPLIENAVKHGLSPLRAGGCIWVEAEADAGPNLPGRTLHVTVRDSGAGASMLTLRRGRSRGVGIGSVERRLKCHYGDAAALSIETAPGRGMRVDLTLPLVLAGQPQPAPIAALDIEP
jgi:hypothetical protein